jgi:proteasome lid subunit RPN8/RPN11
MMTGRVSRVRAGAALRTAAVEHCWVLVGRRRGRIWFARRVRHQAGAQVVVHFDGPWVLAREERRRDVVGFYHTHPGMPARPSRRDVRTMRAWCSAFGKPLLCVIAGADGVRGYRFADHRSEGAELPLVEVFPRGVVIGVEDDGR